MATRKKLPFQLSIGCSPVKHPIAVPLEYNVRRYAGKELTYGSPPYRVCRSDAIDIARGHMQALTLAPGICPK